MDSPEKANPEKPSNLRVGFVTSCSPNDGKQWSGIISRMYNALQLEFESVIPLGPVSLKGILPLASTVDKASRKLFKKPYNYRFKKSLSRILAAEFQKKLRTSPCDVLFAPAASVEIASLKTEIPICYFSDTSFSQISSYYEIYKNYSDKSKREGNEIESMALSNAAAAVLTSRWAVQHVRDFYKIPSEKTFEIPFGANISKWPDAEKVFETKKMSPLRLLFLGVAWERKGGNVALETLEALLEKGIDAELTVCGCIPSATHPKMTVIPFIDKTNEEGARKFCKMMYEHHFLILPTQAEAFGVVFCEASAYGLPSIACNTGGVLSAITEGTNGFLLEPDASGNQFAETILAVISSESNYTALQRSSREEFEKRLNWQSWAKSTRAVLEKISEKTTS